MLKSALESPFQTCGGKDLCKTLEEKATHLCYSIVKNHPMLDGNKRLGAHLLCVFLDINDYVLIFDDDDLIKLIYGIADGSLTIDDLIKLIYGIADGSLTIDDSIAWIKLHVKEK